MYKRPRFCLLLLWFLKTLPDPSVKHHSCLFLFLLLWTECVELLLQLRWFMISLPSVSSNEALGGCVLYLTLERSVLLWR